MKQLLLLGAFCGFMTGLHAQCVPHNGFTGSGIAFSPVPMNPVYAYVGSGDLETVLSLQTFADTTLSVELAPGNPPLNVTVFADLFRLDSIAGLPAGISYTTDAAFDTTYDPIENPFGYWVNDGDTTVGFTPTTGCITFSGAEAAWNAAVDGGPNSDGVYPLTIFLDARAANFSPAAIGGIVGFNTWLSDMGVLLDAFGDPNFTLNGIRLEGNSLDVRASGVGIREVQNSILSGLKVVPNPVTAISEMSFETSEDMILELSIFNALGEKVRSSAVQVKTGVNRVVLDRNGLSTGVYLVMIAGVQHSSTTRIVVQ